MVSFKKTQVATANVVLIGDGSLRSHDVRFLTNEVITGHAVFNLPDGVQLTRSRTTLKGVVTIQHDQHTRAGLQPSVTTDRSEFLSITQSSTPRSGYAPADDTYTVPFRFNLADCARQSALSDLPPSLDSTDEGRANQYAIAYTITSTAYFARGQIATVTQRIAILPVHDGDYPSSISSFPGEYHWATVASPRFKKQSDFQCDVAAQEPEPMLLCPISSVLDGFTEIFVVAKSTSMAVVAPQQCRAHARLVTKTTITPDGTGLDKANGRPSIEHEKYPGSYTVKTSRGHEQEHCVVISNWEQYDSSPTDSFALTKFTIPFNISSDKRLTPTFFTRSLSRTYTIELDISFAEAPGRDYKLSLPVDIVYEVNDCSNSEDEQRRKKSKIPVAEARL